jgi:hypothetical protein
MPFAFAQESVWSHIIFSTVHGQNSRWQETSNVLPGYDVGIPRGEFLCYLFIDNMFDAFRF